MDGSCYDSITGTVVVQFSTQLNDRDNSEMLMLYANDIPSNYLPQNNVTEMITDNRYLFGNSTIEEGVITFRVFENFTMKQFTLEAVSMETSNGDVSTNSVLVNVTDVCGE